MEDLERCWREYEHGARLDQEMTRQRWTVFSALLSVSFVVAGLVIKEISTVGPLLGKAGFAFAWMIFVAGFYHYWWFHQKSHHLRQHLCSLEEKLGIDVYRIRARRPEVAGVRVYYHWVVDALAVAYTALLILVLTR